METWRSEMYHSELYHHGILGMHWGKKKGPPYPLDAEDHSASEKKAGWKKSLGGGRNEKLYDRNKVKSTGSSEDTGNEPKKKGLTDKQKKAIKVGLAVAGTALVAYGGYKLATDPRVRSLASKGLDSIKKRPDINKMIEGSGPDIVKKSDSSTNRGADMANAIRKQAEERAKSRMAPLREANAKSKSTIDSMMREKDLGKAREHLDDLKKNASRQAELNKQAAKNTKKADDFLNDRAAVEKKVRAEYGNPDTSKIKDPEVRKMLEKQIQSSVDWEVSERERLRKKAASAAAGRDPNKVAFATQTAAQRKEDIPRTEIGRTTVDRAAASKFEAIGEDYVQEMLKKNAKMLGL